MSKLYAAHKNINQHKKRKLILKFYFDSISEDKDMHFFFSRRQRQYHKNIRLYKEEVLEIQKEIIFERRTFERGDIIW